MIPPPVEIEVILGRDGFFRRVPLASIAAVTHVSIQTLHESLSGLLLSFLTGDDGLVQAPLGGPSERVGDERNPTNETHEPKKEESENEPTEPERQRTNERGESVREGVTDVLDGLLLASLLDDREHVRTYEALVLRHPQELVAEALAITLARPATSIRTSRGAYFNGLLATLSTRRKGSSPPSLYARTTTPSP